MNEIDIEPFSKWFSQSGLKRAHVLCFLAAVALSLAVVDGANRKAAAKSESSSTQKMVFGRARMSEEITVHAAGRGNPWINLSDGHELIMPYSGPSELTRVLERNEARPLSLCSADFDEDGVPDLISGYAGPNGGIVTLLRGNVDSIYPNAPEAQQRRAAATFTDAPFLSPAFVFGVAEAADFIGAGDFDGDGHWDVVSVARGSDKLTLMSGDGKGGLRETKRIDLPGGATAMVVGGINPRDGLENVMVEVSGAPGPHVLVFEASKGALRANPEKSNQNAIESFSSDGPSSKSELLSGRYEFSNKPVALLTMRLNEDAFGDLVVLSERKIAPTLLMTQATNVYTVSNTNDSGPDSLRQAILEANASPGADVISVLMLPPGSKTINLLSPLPPITDPVTLDGINQAGFLASGKLELNGASAGVLASGLVVAANDTVIQNVVANRFAGAGILLQATSNTHVEGSFIGTDVTGTLASGNREGIDATDALSFVVGGTTAQARNIISGNILSGINISGSPDVIADNRVRGNYIGADVTGSRALPNCDGVIVSFARGTQIGGAAPGAGNVISGNRFDGIGIGRSRTSCLAGILPLPEGGSDFQVEQNFIGTDASGTQPLPNRGDGVGVESDSFSHEIKNNRIAFNLANGIHIPEFGTPQPGFRVRILDNAIFSNAILGIELGDDGVTPNDFQDLDGGANLRQNSPDILSSSFAETSGIGGALAPAATLSLRGTFNSTPNQTFTLQFFFGSGCDASGHQFVGAIPIPLGSMMVSTDSNGDAPYSFSFEFPVGRSSGFVNSTATDATGNTSEPSACLAIFNPLRISSACRGEGKQLIINGSGFRSDSKVFLNGEQEKTSFVSSTQVIAKKAGKRAQTGDTLKVRNPDGSETAVLTYTRNNCSP
jgi:hypothetical protein